jgi:hypothetical protein
MPQTPISGDGNNVTLGEAAKKEAESQRKPPQSLSKLPPAWPVVIGQSNDRPLPTAFTRYCEDKTVRVRRISCSKRSTGNVPDTTWIDPNTSSAF